MNKKSYANGVGIFVIKNNKLLLTKRLKGVQIGKWEVIAGGINPDESYEQAAIREVREETDLDVVVHKYLGINVDDDNNFITHMFLAKIVDGELKNIEPYAHASIEWFDLNNLPEDLGSTTIKGIRLIK